MQHSTGRILTTQTGSLPPPEALADLYVRRAGGEAVDQEALEALGWQATLNAVRSQVEAGIDVGNNGEQRNRTKTTAALGLDPRVSSMNTSRHVSSPG